MQIRTAMDWMRPTRSEQQRYAAALILREMAKNAPAVFNVFVRPFIDVIWFGLRDAKLLVREASRDALRVIPLLLHILPSSIAYIRNGFLCPYDTCRALQYTTPTSPTLLMMFCL